MAGKASGPGEGLPENLAGMTKSQLYDIMSQMKTLIEQNRQQAREILIENPLLTKALFQAQIMLGMVQPPQVIPNIQPAASHHSQQSGQPSQQSNIQGTHSLPGQVGLQEQPGVSQAQAPMRKQNQSQPAMPVAPVSAPPAQLHSQQMPSFPLQMPQQPKAHMNHQPTTMSVSQSSQHVNVPSPLHSTSQPPPLQQPQIPTISSQLQPPMQASGVTHMLLQPPLPPQPRPPSISSYHHQFGPQMGPNVAFQHAGASQHPSQPMFHSGNRPQTAMGPSFSQGQPPLPSQPPLQSLYQSGGSHLGSEFNQGGSSMQADRGSAWMPGPPDSSQLPGTQQLAPSQMGTGNQPSRTAGLTPEMEKALLQQVMSLTPEQINLLPPEQRNQVLQLQQALRQ